MAYLLDANAFIESKNRHYPFDFCPAFWTWLDVQNEKREIYSVQAVREEQLKGEDELCEWAKDRESHLFQPAAKATFLDSADYRLIAHALASGNDRRDAREATGQPEEDQDPELMR